MRLPAVLPVGVVTFTLSSLIELTEELLLTEQPLPRWLRAAWADALAAASEGNSIAPATFPAAPDG